MNRAGHGVFLFENLLGPFNLFEYQTRYQGTNFIIVGSEVESEICNLNGTSITCYWLIYDGILMENYSFYPEMMRVPADYCQTWNYRIVQSLLSVEIDVKGVPMLDSGSAFGDEILTIRFAILENPESFGRKYPTAHLDEVMANLPFWIVAKRGLNPTLVG